MLFRSKDKTGVEIKGIRAVNPVNGQEIPVWVSDYVLMGYGTGAIMAVPAHDERDWEFAKKFGLPIVEVVAGGDVQNAAYTDIQDGVMVNSGILNGLKVKDAIKTIIDYLQEKGLGERKVNYKLRDWVFSRQRYWGEPIPLVYCEHCGWVPLPYDQLPLTLPEVESYMPTDNGESPLAAMTDWVNTTCPKCGGPAKRETDTMPQWAGSSWYFLRYIDPHNDNELASMEEMKYWLPVDWYNGGMEHTTLHLLYSRFWHRFLYDIGVVPTPEPYQKRTSHGMILGADGEKMSKSRGNVVNPDQIVDELGADAFRMYEMFMGAFDQAIPWSTEGARGCRRFLDRVWRLMEMLVDSDKVSSDMAYDVNFTIKKVSEDYELSLIHIYAYCTTSAAGWWRISHKSPGPCIKLSHCGINWRFLRGLLKDCLILCYNELGELIWVLKKYAVPLVIWLLFAAIAVGLWLALENVFYLFNFCLLYTSN